MSKCDFSETILRDRFIDKFNDDSTSAIHQEVPVFSRSVDLVIQNMESSTLTAVEFKLHDWKRAISQVQNVEQCFDFLFICLPKPKTAAGYEAITSCCEVNGIGLIFYDNVLDIFETVIEGNKTTKVWEMQKRRVINYLEANKNGRQVAASPL